MSTNFHERLDRAELPLPSDRSTGLVFAAMALLAAFIWRAHAVVPYVALGGGAAFVIASFVEPRVIRPLNVAWMRLAHLLAQVMNPVVMFVLYAGLIVPAGFLMQLRRDPLQRLRQPDKTSYWLERKRDDRESMSNQF